MAPIRGQAAVVKIAASGMSYVQRAGARDSAAPAAPRQPRPVPAHVGIKIRCYNVPGQDPLRFRRPSLRYLVLGSIALVACPRATSSRRLAPCNRYAGGLSAAITTYCDLLQHKASWWKQFLQSGWASPSDPLARLREDMASPTLACKTCLCFRVRLVAKARQAEAMSPASTARLCVKALRCTPDARDVLGSQTPRPPRLQA